MGLKVELGDAMRDEEEPLAPDFRAAAPSEPSNISTYPHLCPGCAHATVCGIATAILAAGGEGEVAVSVCGEFLPVRAGDDQRAASEK